MNIHSLKTSNQIEQAFKAFKELRPHLSDATTFVEQVQSQMQQTYQIDAILEGEEVVACIGYRFMTTLAWGKIIYIDDLITMEKCRAKGFAKKLLEHVTQIAKENKCEQIHLDTGYQRHAAHKTYLKHGFEFNCHHLALNLS